MTYIHNTNILFVNLAPPLQAQWQALSTSVRLALLSDVQRTVAQASPTQLSTILAALAKIGTAWTDLPAQLQSDVVIQLDGHARRYELNERHLSSLLFSLGDMGLQWRDMDVRLQGGLEQAILRVSVEKSDKSDISARGAGTSAAPAVKTVKSELEVHELLGEQGVSMTLTGLKRMRAQWLDLSEPVREALVSSLSRSAASMNHAQIAASLVALSGLGCRWGGLGQGLPLRQNLLSAVLRLLNAPSAGKEQCQGGMTLAEKSSVVNAFGKMGVRWQADLSQAARRSLLSAVLSVAEHKRSDAQQVAGTLFGLGLMDCTWDTFNVDVRKALAAAVIRVAAPAAITSASSTGSGVPNNASGSGLGQETVSSFTGKNSVDKSDKTDKIDAVDRNIEQSCDSLLYRINRPLPAAAGWKRVWTSLRGGRGNSRTLTQQNANPNVERQRRLDRNSGRGSLTTQAAANLM